MKLVHLMEGLRIFSCSLKRRIKGYRRYSGDAGHICRKIVSGCFNGRYFQASRGHFCEFYTRDFGFCMESLIKLGYKKQVLMTLEYALGIFSKSRITTSISPSGKAFDFPRYSPDSLAFLLMSLRIAGAKPLVKRHRAFLNKEIRKYFENVIDKSTGLVRKDRYFSSMKDHSLRKSSCYDNVMTAVVSENASKLGLDNPFKKYDLKKIIKENFWTGEYFLDDLSGKEHVAGDANIIPFWTGIFTSAKMLKSAANAVQKEGLDKPFPLKYTKSAKADTRHSILDFFASNYEGNSIWMHMGPMYALLLKKAGKNKYRMHKDQYRRMIEKHQNYLEVFDSEGNMFSTLFYNSDESMLWAANYLTL